MKLELFDFIEETMALIEEREESIHSVAVLLEKFFSDSFFIKDHFLNVNYRIKSYESLREKILRHNFYLKYKTPENLVDSISDLIGFRIECRFMEDEARIYRDIIDLFEIELEKGYYTNPLNSNIILNLGMKQPQIQKNGFEIYKIDGKYKKDGTVVNFELQIKSMVNVFWGEIDHRVLYKNFNYMITEDFLRDIMSSIKDNLSMIDRQLMLVYDHLNRMDTSDGINKDNQLKSMISKIVHDVYIGKVKSEIGFVMDFKKSTDVIVAYIFKKGKSKDSEAYSTNFLRILNRLNEIGDNKVFFNEYINFDREPFFTDSFTERVGTNILGVINKDFRWNLFFRILFEIEESSQVEDFEGFLEFLRHKFCKNLQKILAEKNMTTNEKEIIMTEVLDNIAYLFMKDIDVDFLCDCSISDLNKKIEVIFRRVQSYNDWLEHKDKISYTIMDHKY